VADYEDISPYSSQTSLERSTSIEADLDAPYEPPPSVQVVGPIVEPPPSVQPSSNVETEPQAEDTESSDDIPLALAISEVCSVPDTALELILNDSSYSPEKVNPRIGHYRFPNGARVPCLVRGSKVFCPEHEVIIKLKFQNLSTVKCYKEEEELIRSMSRANLSHKFQFSLVDLDDVKAEYLIQNPEAVFSSSPSQPGRAEKPRSSKSYANDMSMPTFETLMGSSELSGKVSASTSEETKSSSTLAKSHQTAESADLASGKSQLSMPTTQPSEKFVRVPTTEEPSRVGTASATETTEETRSNQSPRSTSTDRRSPDVTLVQSSPDVTLVQSTKASYVFGEYPGSIKRTDRTHCIEHYGNLVGSPLTRATLNKLNLPKTFYLEIIHPRWVNGKEIQYRGYLVAAKPEVSAGGRGVCPLTVIGSSL